MNLTRLVLAALAGLMIFGSEAHALSVCPVSDFLLIYEDDETVDLSADQIEIVDAAVNRARMCDLRSIEVFSTAAAANQALWQRRVEAVREALVARGVDERLVEARTAADGSDPDRRDSSREVGVVALVRFR